MARPGHRVLKRAAWGQLGADIDGEAASDYIGVVRRRSSRIVPGLAEGSDGTILAVTAWANDGAGDYAGHVRVYQWSGGSWGQLGSDIDGDRDNTTSAAFLI